MLYSYSNPSGPYRFVRGLIPDIRTAPSPMYASEATVVNTKEMKNVHGVRRSKYQRATHSTINNAQFMEMMSHMAGDAPVCVCVCLWNSDHDTIHFTVQNTISACGYMFTNSARSLARNSFVLHILDMNDLGYRQRVCDR